MSSSNRNAQKIDSHLHSQPGHDPFRDHATPESVENDSRRRLSVGWNDNSDDV
jgi:hypothetical protein